MPPEQEHLTSQTIIAIEQGRYSPSLEMAFQIARVFRVPLDEVFQYPDGEGRAAMKAAVYRRYGPPGVVPVDEVRHVDAGHKRGNVVITMTSDSLTLR
jgi:DNA-binding XRE family transcriptional regulator